jgi:hypothetical protein
LPPLRRSEHTKSDILLNITHHPSRGWPPDMLRAAEEYGPIVDIPFPDVAHEADALEVKKLASLVHAEILRHAEEHETVWVHLMGEQGLCASVHTLHTWEAESVAVKWRLNNIHFLVSSRRRELNRDGRYEWHFIRFRSVL